MSVPEVKINNQNVETIADTIGKCLDSLHQAGVQWNIAEVALAYAYILHRLMTITEKAAKRGTAG